MTDSTKTNDSSHKSLIANNQRNHLQLGELHKEIA